MKLTERIESALVWALIGLVLMAVAAVLPFYFVAGYVALILEEKTWKRLIF